MYIQGDLISGIGRVESNHCGLPWVCGLKGEYCGVIQIKVTEPDYEDGNIKWKSSILADALTGKELTDSEMKERLNNYDYDYEHKSRNCLEWRKKNKVRYDKGRKIDYCIRHNCSFLKFELLCIRNKFLAMIGQ